MEKSEYQTSENTIVKVKFYTKKPITLYFI